MAFTFIELLTEVQPMHERLDAEYKAMVRATQENDIPLFVNSCRNIADVHNKIADHFEARLFAEADRSYKGET